MHLQLAHLHNIWRLIIKEDHIPVFHPCVLPDVGQVRLVLLSAMHVIAAGRRDELYAIKHVRDACSSPAALEKCYCVRARQLPSPRTISSLRQSEQVACSQHSLHACLLSYMLSSTLPAMMIH